MATEHVLDEFYSRQYFACGKDALRASASCSVFLLGIGGLGAEIAKNLVLSGITSITVQDGRICSVCDLSCQFLLNQDDVAMKRNRAEASCDRLKKLNSSLVAIAVTHEFDVARDLKSLKSFQCVIVTDVQLKIQLAIDEFCRNQDPSIKFISANVFGAVAWTFVDFGPNFLVTDADGETDKDISISFVSKSDPAIVTSHDKHGLETGNRIQLLNVQGMTTLNGKCFDVDVLSPSTFAIPIDSSADEFGDYEGEGNARRVKVPQMLHFESLANQLKKPKIFEWNDGRSNRGQSLHLAVYSLQSFWDRKRRLPHPWDENDANILKSFAEDSNNNFFINKFPLNDLLTRQLAKTAQGCIFPLISLLGGIVAQECFKALTGKFTPLQQWFYFDCSELIDLGGTRDLTDDRYSQLRVCLKDTILKKLSDLKIFLAGCGAIGCEVLKNFALLGIGTNAGNITVADDDFVESSNLSTQFFFTTNDVGQIKSGTAAKAVKLLNSDMKLTVIQEKVYPQFTKTHGDKPFQNVDLIVSTLDNFEGRRYLDSLSLKYCLPMLDAGFWGTKAHVQVIVPHETENYAVQCDATEEEIPYCVLKSFPSKIEHTVQWARDKFNRLFHLKPNAFNKFWTDNVNDEEVVQLLSSGEEIEGYILVAKYLKRWPQTTMNCIVHARLLFEKYFNFKAKQLLYTFPLNNKTEDGVKFWQFPKRPPTPVQFNPWNKLHIQFVKSTARLLAISHGIGEHFPENIVNVLLPIHVPEFVPKNKKIEVDENFKKPRSVSFGCYEEPSTCAEQIKDFVNSGKKLPDDVWMTPLDLNKDDPGLDFIIAASNLRASMYGIEVADKWEIHRITKKIVPALITTTSVVASLVTLELLKRVSDGSEIFHQNHFLNLALPLIVSSKPGKMSLVHLKDGISFSIWDRWEIQGNLKYTLRQFIDELVMRTGSTVTMVMEGTRMVYMPLMPGHNSRFENPMLSLLKVDNSNKYCDLQVAFADTAGEDVMGPAIRYYFNSVV